MLSIVTKGKWVIHITFNFSFYTDNTAHSSCCRRIAFSTFKRTGHEKLIIFVILLVLPDGKKCHNICYPGQKESCERNFPVSGIPRNFVWCGGSLTNSVEDRGQRERRSGGGRLLVRGFTLFSNE
jgi:hypothetical protein